MEKLIHKSELEDKFKLILKECQEVFEVTQTNFVEREWLKNKFEDVL